jgi:cysteine desulfurase
MLDPSDLYLDMNATAPLSRAAADAMRDAMEHALVNPASAHRAGERSARLLEAARADVAALVGADPAEVVFTSGATEANHLALFGLLGPPFRGRHLVVSSIEHSSLLEAARLLEELGAEVTRVDPEPSGRIAAAALLAAVRPGTALVALMHSNNETGVLQPVHEVAEALAARGVALHVDAAQSVGRVAVDAKALRATTLAFTSHKLGGPTGIGALVVRAGTRLAPLLRGGKQERGRRGGTQPLLGAIGFAAAARTVLSRGPMGPAVRDTFEARLAALLPGVTIRGADVPRLPNTSSVTIPGADARRLLDELSRRGVHASAGSACQAGAPEPSHVLKAMRLPAAEVRATLRFSFGADHRGEDGARAAELVAATATAIDEAARARGPRAG